MIKSMYNSKEDTIHLECKIKGETYRTQEYPCSCSNYMEDAMRDIAEILANALGE